MGILLRHIYDWSDKNPFIAVLAPVNFSIFQQLKLLFSPYMLWTLVEYTYFGQFAKSFIPIKGVALFVGMVIMAALSILLRKALYGKNFWLDLTVFIISVLAAFSADYLLTSCVLLVFPGGNLLARLILFIAALAICVLTFCPPDHPFFTAPPSCRKSCK